MTEYEQSIEEDKAELAKLNEELAIQEEKISKYRRLINDKKEIIPEEQVV